MQGLLCLLHHNPPWLGLFDFFLVYTKRLLKKPCIVLDICNKIRIIKGWDFGKIGQVLKSVKMLSSIIYLQSTKISGFIAISNNQMRVQYYVWRQEISHCIHATLFYPAIPPRSKRHSDLPKADGGHFSKRMSWQTG